MPDALDNTKKHALDAPEALENRKISRTQSRFLECKVFHKQKRSEFQLSYEHLSQKMTKYPF